MSTKNWLFYTYKKSTLLLLFRRHDIYELLKMTYLQPVWNCQTVIEARNEKPFYFVWGPIHNYTYKYLQMIEYTSLNHVPEVQFQKSLFKTSRSKLFALLILNEGVFKVWDDFFSLVAKNWPTFKNWLEYRLLCLLFFHHFDRQWNYFSLDN